MGALCSNNNEELQDYNFDNSNINNRSIIKENNSLKYIYCFVILNFINNSFDENEKIYIINQIKK